MGHCSPEHCRHYLPRLHFLRRPATLEDVTADVDQVSSDEWLERPLLPPKARKCVVTGLAVLCVVACAGASVPGLTLWGLLAATAAAVTALVWLVMAAGDVRDALEDRPHTPLRWHAIAALAVLLTAAAVETAAPLRGRFGLSKSALADIADSCLAQDRLNGPVCEAPDRAGLYQVASVVRDGESVIITIRTTSFDDVGFVYASDGDPPAGNSDFENPEYRNLGDGWFAFTSSF